MSWQPTALRVMIASPADVKAERKAFDEAILSWNSSHSEWLGVVLVPTRYERDSTYALGMRPQELINREIVDRAEIMVGAFWTRLGTPSGVEPSGTVEEIKRFHAQGKPVILLFSDASIPPSAVDPEQYSQVLEFREWAEKNGLFGEYSSLEDFRSQVKDQLLRTVQTLRAGRTTRARGTPTVPADPIDTADIERPTDTLEPVDLEQITVKKLLRLTTAILAPVPDPGLRHWSRLRWKTIYTIDLRRRLAGSLPDFIDDTLIRFIRHAGATAAERLLDGDETVVRAFRDSTAFNGGPLGELWFADTVSLKDLRGESADHPTAVSIIPEDARHATPTELARVILCEIMLSALIEIGARARNKAGGYIERAFGGSLHGLGRLMRELVVCNAFRGIDSMLVGPIPAEADLAPASALGYLLPRRRKCAACFDYLLRWQDRMEVLVLSNDSETASAAGVGGPFARKPANYDASYRSFIEKGRGLGIEVLVTHPSDFDPDWRFATVWKLGSAWTPQPGVFTEFLYDKFPTNLQTVALKDRIATDKRIRIWNRVTFTELLADKCETATLLGERGVPIVGPTLKLKPDAGREERERIVATLSEAVHSARMDTPADGKWIVVKPISGWSAAGVKCLTSDEFMHADLTVSPYADYEAVVVQPFFESGLPIDELGIRGRHDVRVVFAGGQPVFVMIRELPVGTAVHAASLASVRAEGGDRRYVEVSRLLRRADAADLVNRVRSVLATAFPGIPAIYSVDFLWTKSGSEVAPLVIELNSKPSQVWEENDEVGREMIGRFQDAIVNEFAAF